MVKKILNIVGRLLMVLSIVYIFIYLYNVELDWTMVKNQRAFVLLLCCGVIIIAMCVFIEGTVWSNILRGLSEQQFNFKESVRVYTKANIGKYLPGNVMHYVERNIFAAKEGIGQKEAALSSILEIGVEVIAAGLIAVIFIYEDLKSVVVQVVNIQLMVMILAVLAMAVIAGCIIPFHISSIRGMFQNIVKKAASRKFVGIIFVSVLEYSLVFFLMGLLLLGILTKVLWCSFTIFQCGKVISAYILAWLIGFVVPGAPGGIGIREFVLITILSSFISEQEILFAIIFHRIITVAGDVLAYIFFNRVGIRKN